MSQPFFYFRMRGSMSIKISTKVWETSRHTGTTLLAMLVLADHSNDDGYCWPGMAGIAFKARIKERQCVNVIQTLETSGELYLDRGVGRHGTSKYLIVLGLEIPEIAVRLIRYFDCPKAQSIAVAERLYKKVQSAAPLPANTKKVQFLTKKVQSSVRKGAAAYRKGAIAIAPESSITTIQPSKETSIAAKAAAPLNPTTKTPKASKPKEGTKKRTSSPLKPSAPLADVPRARNVMMDRITTLTHTTPAMAAAQIAGLIKKLKASNYNETHIDYFEMWWCQDWRSKDNDGAHTMVPTVGQIGQLFGVAMAWAEKHAPKPAPIAENLSPEDEAALEAQLIAEMQAREIDIERRRELARVEAEQAKAGNIS